MFRLSIVKSKLTLFERQEELFISQSIKLSPPSFSEAPKAFNAVDMEFSSCKFILRRVDAIVVIAIEDEAIIGLQCFLLVFSLV